MPDFDKLPPALRGALANAVQNYSGSQILRDMKTQNLTVRFMIEAIQDCDRGYYVSGVHDGEICGGQLTGPDISQ